MMEKPAIWVRAKASRGHLHPNLLSTKTGTKLPAMQPKGKSDPNQDTAVSSIPKPVSSSLFKIHGSLTVESYQILDV